MDNKLFSLDGQERLNIIKDLPFDITDEICQKYGSCDHCPLAVIFNSKVYCADATAFYRVGSLLKKGGKFTQSEEVINETNG